MQKITTFMWFDDKAEEAMKFYVSLFKNSKILSITRYGDPPPGAPTPWPKGKVLTGVFELAGQTFMALDGGPQFPFTEAISLYVSCETQNEVDDLWAKLTADGGQEVQCGWLKDKFGVSWQIVPSAYEDMMADPKGTPAQKHALMSALLQMTKLDIKALREAYEKG